MLLPAFADAGNVSQSLNRPALRIRLKTLSGEAASRKAREASRQSIVLKSIVEFVIACWRRSPTKDGLRNTTV